MCWRFGELGRAPAGESSEWGETAWLTLAVHAERALQSTPEPSKVPLAEAFRACGRHDRRVLSVFGGVFARSPWSTLGELRGENGGVHRVAAPDGPPAWFVTRYDDVRSSLLDGRLATDVRHARGEDYKGFVVPPPMDVFSRSDPDQLSRLRRAITAELHPARLDAWAECADELTISLLKRLSGESAIDFVERIAVPLPAAVLEQLLGLPPEVGSGLRHWAKSALRPDAGLRARDTLGTMHELVQAAIEYGRRSDQSMLARLTQTDLLDSEQLASLLFYLLFVFYEVLVDLLGGAVAAFADDPAQREMFACQPDRIRAVDELVRYLSPQMAAGPRFAVEDLVINGRHIRAGQTVLLSLAAANHDPSIFDNPEKLDIGRTRNPHLGFGLGAHTCVGAGLVRPVAAAVLSRIVAARPGLQVVCGPDEIMWRNGFRHRGPLALPVKL